MLSTLDYVNVLVSVAVVASYAYVIFLARRIRRTLGFGLYRKQAAGLALIALTFMAGDLSNFVYSYSFAFSPLDFLTGLVFFAQALFLLYWVDSSILAARRTDPLVRDTLSWSKLRLIAWGVAAATAVVSFTALLAYSVWYPTGAAPNEVTVVVNLLGNLFTVPIYTAALTGVVVLPIAARRSKDATLRNHLLWFFAFIVINLTLQGGVAALVDPITAQLVDGVALLLGLYPLYRSAKRLVPLYKFSGDTASESAGPTIQAPR